MTSFSVSNIFSVRGHRTLKPRSKFISRTLIFFNSKLNGRKLGLNTSLSYYIYKLACNERFTILLRKINICLVLTAYSFSFCSESHNE